MKISTVRGLDPKREININTPTAETPTRVRQTLLMAVLLVMAACTAPARGADTVAAPAGPTSAPNDPVSAGWSALWDNRLDEAIGIFRGVLDGTTAVDRSARAQGAGAAARGLAIAYSARGFERRAVDTVLNLPGGSAPEPLDFLAINWLYRDTYTHGKDELSFQKALERVAAQTGLDALDRRAVLATAGSFALRNGEVATLEKMRDQLNRIGQWSILGPFDNTSWSGRTKDFLQGDQAGSWPNYKGKAGQLFTWHNPTRLSLLNEIHFDSHLARSQAISAYAGTAIEVRKAGTFLLSVCKSGALTLALDDTLLIELDEETNQDELLHFEVDLPVGRHTLLAKISVIDGAPRLAASLSNPDGQRAKDVVCRPLAPGSLRGDGGVAWRRRDLPLLAETARRVEADSLDATAAYWRLVALMVFDQREEARQFAEVVERRFPDSVVIRLAIAQALVRAEDTDGYLAQMRQAAAIAPLNPHALVWQATEHVRRRAYTRADSVFSTVLADCPDFPTAEMERIASYRAQGMATELQSAAVAFQRRYPDYSIAYRLLSEHFAGVDQRRSERLLMQAIERSNRIDQLSALIKQSEGREDFDQVLTLMKEVQKLLPDSPSLATQLAIQMLRADDDKGLDLAQANAALFPYSYEAQHLQAYLAELMAANDPSARPVAVEHYGRALALRPGDFQTRDRLRTLNGLKPISEIFAPIDLDRIRGTAPEAATYAGSDACVLADHRRRIMFPDGSNYAERALSILIATADGARRFGSLHTGVNPMFSDLNILEARTIKADGKIVEAQRQLAEVAFESVAPGDIIEFHYQSSSWNVGTLNQEFWDSHIFEWDVPCLSSQYELLLPPGTEFQWKIHHLADTGEVYSTRELGEFELHAWRRHDIPPRRDEVCTPNLRDMWAWLDISSLTDWNQAAAWYLDLSGAPSRQDPRVGRKVREIIGDSTDQKAIIEKLYEFVANQVTYENLNFQYSAFIPEPARDVLRMQFGDCKDKVCLLKSMLESAGIASSFALLSPISDGIVPYLPSPRFSHAMLAIPEGAGYRFLDPTLSDVPAGRLSEAYRGTSVLVIDPATRDLTTIPFVPAEQADSILATSMSLDNESDLLLARREIHHGADRIADLRSRFATCDQSQRSSRLTTDLGKRHVGVEVLKDEWQGLEGTADAVEIKYEARVRDGVSRSGQLQLVKLPWRSAISEQHAVLVAGADRESPLLLYELRVHEEEALTFNLPAGLHPESMPEPVTLESPYGEFSIRCAMSGTNVEMQRRLRISGNVLPPEEYAAFKRFLERVIREQNSVMVLAR